MGSVPKHDILVGEVALPVEKMVVLRPTDVFRVAVEKMSQGRLGIACVVEQDGTLAGVFTDGDIRRLLLSQHKPIAALFSEDIGDHMIRSPKTIKATTSLKEGVSLMEAADVLDLPVIEESGRLIGLLHLHTALKHLLGL
jgi:CBS domain-containing protein